MSLETRADFARRLGVNRSTITRWVETGRVVLSGALIDVEASQQRLAETGGARPDVAERHAAERAAKGATVGAGDTPPPAAPPASDAASRADGVGNSYQAARAVKEKYAALHAKLEYEQALGNLIPKGDVDLALRSFAASVRAKLDVLPDQISPLVAPVSDLDEVHALLAEHCRGILSAVADDMGRAATAAGQGAI